MTNQAPEPWLTVTDAAALVGRSVSTIRRLLPEVEAEEPAAIRREPLEGKGGEKVFLSRAWLLARFGVNESAQEPQGAAGMVDAAGLVGILERQLEAKDKQINALQREAEAKSRQIEEAQRLTGELSERVGQLAAVNATLQTRILQITAAGEGSARPTAAAQGAREVWYYVLLSVLLSLCAGLLLWLLLGWVGNG